jgi:hypothetical protein
MRVKHLLGMVARVGDSVISGKAGEAAGCASFLFESLQESRDVCPAAVGMQEQIVIFTGVGLDLDRAAPLTGQLL